MSKLDTMTDEDIERMEQRIIELEREVERLKKILDEAG